MPEASAYTPPSREPAEIAERLSAYIARNKAHAHRYVEGEADTPMIQFGYMAGLYLHIRRLEHQMRCFILFLAAQLIARGLVRPAPLTLWQRGTSDHTGPSPLIRRQDRELRALLANTPRLCTFSITTPVIEGGKRRSKRRVKSQYKLLPDSLKPVDARHLLARYGRLSRVLLRADVLATRLAGRALTVRLEAEQTLSSRMLCKTQLCNAGPGSEASVIRVSGPVSAVRDFAPHHARDDKTALPAEDPSAGWGPRLNTGKEPGPTLRHGYLPSQVSAETAQRGSQKPAASDWMPGGQPAPSEPPRGVRQNNNPTNPLYLQSLHSWLAPEPLWESAKDLDDEREDLTALHMMATEGVTAAGFPPGPDPKFQLPSFEAWKPPDPPQIRTF